MTETERLTNAVTKFQLLANSMAFLMTDKTGGLENDALLLQTKNAMKDFIRTEILNGVKHEPISVA